MRNRRCSGRHALSYRNQRRACEARYLTLRKIAPLASPSTTASAPCTSTSSKVDPEASPGTKAVPRRAGGGGGGVGHRRNAPNPNTRTISTIVHRGQRQP